jgi:hypothetical protein
LDLLLSAIDQGEPLHVSIYSHEAYERACSNFCEGGYETGNKLALQREELERPSGLASEYLVGYEGKIAYENLLIVHDSLGGHRCIFNTLKPPPASLWSWVADIARWSGRIPSS